jgi:methionyl-tRNA synthetase
VIGAGNGYVAKQAPWTLRKQEPARMQTVLFVAAETLRRLALLAQPFMPQSASRMLDQLCVPKDTRAFASMTADHAVMPGTLLPPASAVFPRYVERANSARA